MTAFLEKLQAAQVANDSWVCVGLDPAPDRMPEPLRRQNNPFLPFLKAIVDATTDLVCAYKPNLGFYLTQGSAGVIALERISAYIPDRIPIILDAKFNDIGHTVQAYARAAFDRFGADAITANPYLGQDGIAPFLSRADKAVFVLARTSNPSARDFQDLRLSKSSGSVEGDVESEGLENPTLYEIIAHQATTWDQRFPGTCGLVVGATYPQELAQVRALAPDLPFLIPGIGAQGGDMEAAVDFGPTGQGVGPVINTSRGVLYASAGEDFADAARRAADELRKKINARRK